MPTCVHDCPDPNNTPTPTPDPNLNPNPNPNPNPNSNPNQLYEDKLALRQQLAAATAESKAAEETVANYRRGMVDLLDV